MGAGQRDLLLVLGWVPILLFGSEIQRWTLDGASCFGIGTDGTNNTFVNFEDGRWVAQVVIGVGGSTNNTF